MDKKYIDYCRYYKGEKECPRKFIGNPQIIHASLFWYGERLFVENEGNIEEEKNIMHAYFMCGLAEIETNLPISLLASIFWELCRHSDTSPEYDAVFFKDVIVPEYLGQP